jgi:RNA polymerase sigma-70 factor (ECF subfamily)
MPERLPAVLAVLYLVFNEGYSATSGDRLVRTDLCEEAIRLAGVVAALLPGEPEALALRALLVLQHSRRATRTDADGRLVLLADQDRSRWDQEAIAEGLGLLEHVGRALAGSGADGPLGAGGPRAAGPYALQAAIAAEHARAPTAERTRWDRIAHAYTLLAALDASPVVALNRAVALAMAHGPERGLAAMDALAASLEHYHHFHAARADLLRRAGRHREAILAYRRALALVRQPTERAFLAGRVAELSARRARWESAPPPRRP